MTDNRKFTFVFEDNTVVEGMSWDGVTDDNNFFEAEVNSMNNMGIGKTFDAGFVVVTRTQ